MINLDKLIGFKFFKDFKKSELEELLKIIDYKLIKFHKDDIIFFREENLDGIYIILNGILSAEMLKTTGEIQKVENLSVGDIIASAFIFGENNILPVDLLAIKNGEVLHIDKKNLLKLFKLNEKILINFLDEISDRAQFLSNKVWKNFNNKTIKEKLVDYIFENVENENITFKHSINELSEMFGVSRPSLSRIISKLVKDEELIRAGKNKFILNKLKKNKKTVDTN